jgi:hypothetical protein
MPEEIPFQTDGGIVNNTMEEPVAFQSDGVSFQTDGVIFKNTRDNQCLSFSTVPWHEPATLSTCVLSFEPGDNNEDGEYRPSWKNPALALQWSYINTEASDINQLYQIKDNTGEKCLQPNSDNGGFTNNTIIMGSCDASYTTFHKYDYSHTNYLSDWNQGDGVLFPRPPPFNLYYADNSSAYVDGTSNLMGKAVINKAHTDNSYMINSWWFDSISNVKIDGVDVSSHDFDILKNVTAECFLVCRYLRYDSSGEIDSDTPYTFIYDEANNQLLFSETTGTDTMQVKYDSIRSGRKVFIDLTGKTMYPNNLPKINNQIMKIGIRKDDGTILYAKVDHRVNKIGMILQETDPTFFNISLIDVPTRRLTMSTNIATEAVVVLPQDSSNGTKNLASFMNPYKKLYVNDSDNQVMIKGIDDGTGDTTFDFNIVPYNA